MLARVLLLGLLALVGLSFPAWATGPANYPPGGSGSGVVANTCTSGDFFSAVDGSGNFTCATPAGSGDVTAVGDCASGACFDGTSGTTLTGSGASTVLQGTGSLYFNLDTNADSSGDGFVVADNSTGTGGTKLFEINESNNAYLYNNMALRFREATANGSSAVIVTGPASMTTSPTIAFPEASGTVAVSATSPLSLSAAGDLSITADGIGSSQLAATFTATTITSNLVGNVTGNADTATALAANPADCSADTYATTIAASGALTCSTVTNAGLAGSIAMSKTLLTADAGVALSTNSLTTASDEQNFVKSGALTCGASTNGKMQVHTTPLQYCDNAATPTLQYAAYGSSTGVATSATALAANGANCSAGNYPLGVDASGAVETCTADDDVPESGDFGALALTGDVSSSGLTTTIGADKVTEAMLKATNSATDEYCLTYETTTGDFTWQDCDSNGGTARNTLLAGRAGTANDTTLSTNGTGTLYGSGTTANDLTLRPNSVNTTTGEINANGYVDFWPSIATNASQTSVAGFSPTITLSDGGGYSLMDFNPTLSVPDISSIQAFRVRGSIDRTGTTGSSLYQFTGFHMGTSFTSSTTGGPLFQDAFFDASVVNQVSGTATQNTYQPISFLSKPTYKAAAGASLTIGQTTGVDINPSWGVAAGGTLTNTTFSAFKLHAPNEIGGTLSLPNYIALDVEDLDTAGVTTPLSLRSVGTTTEMRHAGAARFGATGAVTSGKKLDVQGDTYIGTYLDIGDDLADISTGTTKVIDIAPAIDITSTGTLTGVDVSSTGTTSGTANHYGLKAAPVRTVSGDLAAFYGVEAAGTLTQTGSPTFGTVGKTLNHVTTYTTATAGVKPAYRVYDVFGAPTLSSSATSSTSNVNTVWGHWSNPTVSQTGNGGTLAVASMIGAEYTGTVSAGTGGTTTVTTRTAVKVNDVAKSASGGTETVTTNIGVDIAALSKATTNIGIRNADTTVYTPGSAQTLNTAGSSITPSETYIKVTASGATGTLTSNPQIADGVDGQIIYIIYTNGGTGSFTFADGNGLQLAGTMLMDQNNSITLMYSSAIGDWIELARSLN